MDSNLQPLDYWNNFKIGTIRKKLLNKKGTKWSSDYQLIIAHFLPTLCPLTYELICPNDIAPPIAILMILMQIQTSNFNVLFQQFKSPKIQGKIAY